MSAKKIAIIGSGLICFLLILIGLLLSAKPTQKITVEDKIPSRLTATPFVAKSPSVSQIPTPIDRFSTLAPTPTLIIISPTSVASPSATPQSEKKLGRLSYFSGSSLQNTDLSMSQTLAQQISTAAGNLKWSPKGTYLSWVTLQGDKGSQISYLDPTLNQKKNILFEGTSFIDYVWSNDESKIAILYGEEIQTLAQVSVKMGEKPIQNLMILPYPANKLFWLKDGSLLISGKKGIYDYDEITKQWSPVVVSDSFVGMKLSPDEKTIAYALQTGDKIGWFLLGRDTNTPETISLNEANSDLTQVQLPFSALEKGYDTKIAWYPDSSRLLISFKHLRDFPVVGDYSLLTRRFKSLGIFSLQESDKIIDNYTLMGEKVVNQNGVGESQIQFFSLEDNGKVGLVKVLPKSRSGAFYPGN